MLRNPLYFVFLILMGVGAYVTYTLNLWGPILRMTNAASSQGLDIFKEKLRDFLETTDTGRQAVGMSAKGSYRYVPFFPSPVCDLMGSTTKLTSLILQHGLAEQQRHDENEGLDPGRC